MKKNFLFITSNILLLILLIEISARIFLNYANVWVEDDSTWRRDWISKTKEDGGKKLTYQSYDVYDSTKGWYTKPNIRNMIITNDQKYLNTNSRGIRGTKEHRYRNTTKKKRILVLGDSFTFGEEVGDNETFPYYLQQFMPEYEIINMGVHGYGIDQIYLLYSEEGVKYKPDYLILGFVREDLRRNLLDFRDYAKPKFIVRNGNLILTGVPVSKPAEIINSYKYSLGSIDIISMLYQKFLEYTGIYNDRIKEISTLLLDNILNKTLEINAKPIFVYIPEYDYEIERYYDKSRELYYHKFGKDFFLEYCTKHKRLYCFSTVDKMKSQLLKGEDIRKEHYGHWNEIGNYWIAESIFEFMNNEPGLIRKKN